MIIRAMGHMFQMSSTEMNECIKEHLPTKQQKNKKLSAGFTHNYTYMYVSETKLHRHT